MDSCHKEHEVMSVKAIRCCCRIGWLNNMMILKVVRACWPHLLDAMAEQAI